jgi:hypothetical protein
MNLLIVDPTRRPRSHYNPSASRAQNLGKFRHLVTLANHLHQYGVNIHYASYLPTNISEDGDISYYNLSDREAMAEIHEDVALILNDPTWAGAASGGAKRVLLPLETIGFCTTDTDVASLDMIIGMSHYHTRLLKQGAPKAFQDRVVTASFGVTNELYHEYPQKEDRVLFVGGYQQGLHEAMLFWNSFSKDHDMEFVVVTPETEGKEIDTLREAGATLYHDIPHSQLVSIMGGSLFAIRPATIPSYFDSTTLECMCAGTPVFSINQDDYVSYLVAEHGAGVETILRTGAAAWSQVTDLVRIANNFLKDYDAQGRLMDNGVNMLIGGQYDWRDHLNHWADLLCT